MNYIYAALLLHSAGKPITEETVSKLVIASGEPVDPARTKALVSALENIDIKAAIEKAAMPVAAAPAAAPSAEPKKEEKQEEVTKKAEQAAEGLSALFG